MYLVPPVASVPHGEDPPDCGGEGGEGDEDVAQTEGGHSSTVAYAASDDEQHMITLSI